MSKLTTFKQFTTVSWFSRLELVDIFKGGHHESFHKLRLTFEKTNQNPVTRPLLCKDCFTRVVEVVTHHHHSGEFTKTDIRNPKLC